MKKFENKVVIVTGASSGIGESTAIAFAKEGAKLTITGRNEERLAATVKKCADAGAEILEIVGDLKNYETLEPLINKTVEKFGRIDVLINNAGYGVMGNIEEMDLDSYEGILKTNLRAPVFLCKFAVPHLRKTKGCVVNVSSIASVQAIPGLGYYCITKAALDHFTRGFSAECAPFGVRVNSINPGYVLTRFSEHMNLTEEVRAKTIEYYSKKQPLGVITSEQVADGILFLCSSPMITGVSLPMDGGLVYST